MHRHDGGLDQGAAERTEAKRDKAAAQQGGQQADDTRLVDEGEERPREEVLVRAHRQDVPVLQMPQRHGEYACECVLSEEARHNATVCSTITTNSISLLKSRSLVRFQNPIGQINMRDARVEEVEHVSDSDSEERDAECPHERTIGIFPTHQGPTYLLMPHKQDKDNWLYHLTVVSGGGPSAGTQYEQLVQRLMETDGDPTCVLWRHPLLLHTKENITSPLTSLTSESLQTEAIKLFKVDTIRSLRGGYFLVFNAVLQTGVYVYFCFTFSAQKETCG